jgi:alpha-amylase
MLPNVCIGFVVHRPVRLTQNFSPNPNNKKKSVNELYFDGLNREVLERTASRCYLPATDIILEGLDEGFRCSFSFSGTVIEQLDKWCPDVMAQFEQVARHRNVELLGQTYYHSIASCFSDKAEFEEQVKLHADLIYDMFHICPTIFTNTDLAFNRDIASCIRNMRFLGIITEGVDRILEGRDPHHIYRCENIPVLLRDGQLSNAIALRFGDTNWADYPLTADKYTDWIAASSGDIITIFLNYETFGEHFSEKTGIFEFLRHLPDQMSEKGIKTALPTSLVEHLPTAGEINVTDMISWNEHRNDISAWMGNERQLTMFTALEKARYFAVNREIWRHLQASDHFSRVASNQKAYPDGQTSIGQSGGEDAFVTYMNVLADLESRSIRVLRSQMSAKTLRTVTADKAFYFFTSSGFLGYTAYNLDQFSSLLRVLPQDSLVYHQERGDFSRWIEDVLSDKRLAEDIRGCTKREDISQIVDTRRGQLWKRLR